jgi:predicted PurR-regulated permease PerM
MTSVRRDLARTVFSVLFIGVLVASSLWILRPFLPAFIWATMITVATWPVMLRLQQVLWGRRWAAAVAMSLALLLVFALPLTWAIGALAANAAKIAELAKSLAEMNFPALPAWIEQLPLIGSRLAARWQEFSVLGVEEWRQRIAPYGADIARWLLSMIGDVGMIGLQFLLIVLISGILFFYGEVAAMGIRRFAWRLSGMDGEQAVILAGRAIRGVMLGVVGTALIQSLLGGIGLVVAGVPFAAALTFVMFLLAVAQIGAVPVLLGALFWLYSKGDTGWMMALLGWTVFVGSIDNVIRPILIKKGADLPFLLIFAGVVGGLLAFGLIGLFIGPVTLAVAYMLLEAWVKLEPYEAGHPQQPDQK